MLQTVLCLIGGVTGLLLEVLPLPASIESVARVAAIAAYLISYLAGSWHPLTHAIGDLRRGRVNIDLLMIAAAWGAAALGNWVDGAALLFLFSLSHALEGIILGRTRRAISDLMDFAPDEATRLDHGDQTRVAVETLVAGERVLVRPGERFPTDGVLRVGHTSVDESPVNGESTPADKSPGDLVYAGSLNQEGVIEVEVLRPAQQSTLARMVELVEQAQSQRATTQRWTEWFGERYTWFVLAFSLTVLLVSRGVMTEPWSASLYRMMTVLVAASPCAVVISIPAAILAAISSAARGGVLFKGGSAVERAATLKGMAFDKTGTLTLGQVRLVGAHPARNVSAERLLGITAALEADSEHPLARAVVQGAKDRHIAPLTAESVQAVPGHGIVGTVDGTKVLAGKLTWIVQEHGPLPVELADPVKQAQERGETVVAAWQDGQWLGVVMLADTLRPTAAACLRDLRAAGVTHLRMLTGDAEEVARRIGTELDLPWRAALLPEHKGQILEAWRKEVGPIGMIGDGLNDAPSLAMADLGFSLGGAGTDVALETADVVILADDLRRLPYAIRLARQAQRVILQNLLCAFGVMIVLVIAALTTPLPLPLAVLGHEGSTVLVILNGLRMLAFPKVVDR